MSVSSVGTPTEAHATLSGSGTLTVTGTWGTGQTRTAGNILAAFVTYGAATSSGATAEHTGTTGWTKQFEQFSGSGSGIALVALWTKTAAGSDAAPSFDSTVSTSGTAVGSITLFELSGASGTFDTSGTVSYSNVTINSQSVTTAANVSNSGEYAIACFVRWRNASTTNAWTSTGTGFSNATNNGGTALPTHTACDVHANPSTGATQTGSGNWGGTNTSASGAGLIVVFNQATSGFGTPYTVVTGAGPSGANTLQVTVSSNAAVGDVLVIGAGNDSAGSAPTGVTDSQGNVYTLAKSDFNQADGLAVYTANVTTALVSGTDWIKATYAGSGGAMTLNGRGISGADPNGVDVSISNDNAASTSPSSGSSGTLASAHEWAVAFLINGNGGGTPTAWTGGFTAQNTAHQTSNQYQTVADQVVTATTALTAGATITSATWAMVLVTVQQKGTAALKAAVSDTVTATVTAGIAVGHKIDVSETITANRTPNIVNAVKVAVSQSVTASRSANITVQTAGNFSLDVVKTFTATVTPGTKLAAVAKVTDTITASRSVDLGQTGPPPGLGTPYTLVSGTGAVNLSNTLQVTVEATTAAGDAFVVGAGNNGSGVTCTGVTDSQGNVYTLAKADNNQSDKISVYVALNTVPLVSGVDWIKATYSGAGGAKTLNGRGCAGIAHTSAVDVAISNDAASGTAMSVGPSAALVQGAEWALAFSISGNTGGQATSWTGNFTPQDTAHVATNQYQTVADQIVSNTNPLTAGATIASTKWAMVLVTLKAAGGTPYQIDVSDTVTAAVTTNDKLAAKAAVTDTVAATVTASITGKGLAVAQTITASRTAGIAKNAFTIDVSKTITATVTDNARRGRPIQVSQSLTMPVTTGFHLSAVAAVNDILTAAITPGPNHNAPLDVALTVTASDAAGVSFGAVQVLAQWTESAVNDYGVSILGINNTPNACLAAFIGWSADDATRNPIVYVADDAHNYWVPLEVSDPNSLQRGSIWVCTNAQVGDPQTGITTVTVSSTLPTAGIAFNIVELSNMPPTVVLSGLESSDHSNATTGLTASGTAVAPAWGFALYVSDGPTSAQPGTPWGALSTGSTFNPGQGGGGLIDVATTVTASVTASISGGSAAVNKIDVSKTVIATTTAALTVTTPPPGGGNPALLYCGANTGPQGAPNITNFTDMLTGANGLPDMGPIGCYKAFYSAGGSGIYTGSLPASWSGTLEDQVTRAQPGLFAYISWGVLHSQAAINSYVGSIPATDKNGNQMVVGFTYQSEPEHAYPATATGGSQFISDWIDQAKKIRTAHSTFWPNGGGPKLVLITSHYMPAYGSDGSNAAAVAGDFIPPAVSGGVTVTDVWGADLYQAELASGSFWSTAGLSNNQRWTTWVPLVKSKSGISNPQFALTEYGVKYSLTNVGTTANGNNIRNQRFGADWTYIQGAFGPGGSVSQLPLFLWLFWNDPPTSTAPDPNYFSDGPTVATANSIISAASMKMGVGH